MKQYQINLLKGALEDMIRLATIAIHADEEDDVKQDDRKRIERAKRILAQSELEP